MLLYKIKIIKHITKDLKIRALQFDAFEANGLIFIELHLQMLN